MAALSSIFPCRDLAKPPSFECGAALSNRRGSHTINLHIDTRGDAPYGLSVMDHSRSDIRGEDRILIHGAGPSIISRSLLFPLSILFILLISILAAGCKGSKGEKGFTENQEASKGITVDPEQYWTTWRDTVRRGDTLWDILDRHQVYMADVNRLLNGVHGDEPFSWRHLMPGQLLEGKHDEMGSLRQVLYLLNREDIFQLELAGDSVSVSACSVVRETQWRRLQAVVNSTVDAALRRAGGNPLLLHELAATLSWDLDFFTDPRKGDTLDLVVEEIYIDGEFFRFGDIQWVTYRGEKVSTTGVRFHALDREGPEYYDLEGRNLRKSFLKSPLNYTRISSTFSQHRFHPILKKYRPHLGVDYAAPSGTPVVSVADGEVSQAEWNGGFGRYIKIRHAGQIYTTYGHLRKFAKGIRRGARVKQNQVIGYVGATGLATGPHLDYRVMRDGRFVDPLRLKNPPTHPIPETDWDRFREHLTWLEKEIHDLLPGKRIPAPSAPHFSPKDGATISVAAAEGGSP